MSLTSNFDCRLCIVRQPDVGAGGDPGDERLPNRHEAAEGPAEAAQGCQPALLTQDAVPARSTRAHGMFPTLLFHIFVVVRSVIILFYSQINNLNLIALTVQLTLFQVAAASHGTPEARQFAYYQQFYGIYYTFTV